MPYGSGAYGSAPFGGLAEAPLPPIIAPDGIASTEAWGTPTLAAVSSQTLAVFAIVSTEAWGIPTVASAGTYTIYPSSIVD